MIPIRLSLVMELLVIIFRTETLSLFLMFLQAQMRLTKQTLLLLVLFLVTIKLLSTQILRQWQVLKEKQFNQLNSMRHIIIVHKIVQWQLQILKFYWNKTILLLIRFLFGVEKKTHHQSMEKFISHSNQNLAF